MRLPNRQAKGNIDRLVQHLSSTLVPSDLWPSAAPARALLRFPPTPYPWVVLPSREPCGRYPHTRSMRIVDSTLEWDLDGMSGGPVYTREYQAIALRWWASL